MKEPDFPGSIGEWIKARRKRLDLTQEELARRAGCSVFALRKIESGERRPSKQLAGLLATALEIWEEDAQTFIRTARGELNPEKLAPLASDRFPASPPDPRPAPHHLPLPTTPLLGRDTELDALERLFNDPQCRLLTLTGMGGIGKTSLAVEFASSRRGMFPGGVIFTPLASINSAELIVPAIAEALEFSFSGPLDPKEQLVAYLVNTLTSPALLLLDNLEHLISASSEATGVVSEFLQRVPPLKILTTSRERLNLHGEWLYELHGLPVPPDKYAENFEAYSAVALFVQCARRIHLGFEIREDEKAALARICSLLEGIPLAIELAAAWTGILSCDEIAREIESNIDFLESSTRDIPERHRSMRASFNHSWKLLSETERVALCRLAVFHGGFDRIAAQRIAGATLPLLASLASKSLVRRGENGRYDLHEVVRQFALSQQDESPAQHFEAREAHSAYYLAFAAAREKDLRSAPQQPAAREMIDEIDNIRAAWIWAIRGEEFSLLGSSIRSLGWFFEVTGLIREGIEQFEPLVRVLKTKAPDHEWQWVLGQALTQQGMLYFRKGLFDRAQALMEESLCVLRPVGRPSLLTDSLVYLGIVMHLNGDIQRSRTLLEEGLTCAQSANDEWFRAYAIYNLGYVDSLTGLYQQGLEQMREGMSIWRSLGDPHSISLGLNYLSPTLVKLGRYEEAEAFLQESLALCKVFKNRWGMGTAYRYLGMVKNVIGDLKAARSFLQKSLDTFGDYIVGWDIARTLTYLGETERLSGELVQAKKIYSDALHLAKKARSIPLMLDALAGLAQLALQSGMPEQALELSVFVLNQTASIQDTKERAGQVIPAAEASLGREKVDHIKDKAVTENLETVVNWVDLEQ